MSRPGDWICRSCQYLNFSWRDTCQVCCDLRDYGDSIPVTAGDRGAGVLPGDWYCTSGNCGAHNYASRLNCFICGGIRDDCDHMARSRSRSAGWKSGDWICTRPGCNEHNFASRMECYKCNTPKKFG